ncbi:phosphogluconate dehydrogenase (NADP(+)-dependent, decarboxylating) [Candidatus Heimdallarchaeota archaeon B3_Heim]|nr:MAG: phosphogluconate dehydrogenase (NADP(+)-dependent, decarboxylating) [Candidatus Heimdallarchaeota archaeon B3_Heim]
MEKKDIGLIGLGVMGQNLTLNMERNGYSLAVYNRTKSKTMAFLRGVGKGKAIIGYNNIEEFCKNLKPPRKIFLMVKAGNVVDHIITELEKYIDSADIVIDGGNSYFMDTQRRCVDSEKKNYHFLGIGISGGEEGALRGPSIMPGGSEEAWENTKEILLKIAAKADNQPCCSYMGSNGAGHYVKMVHNGIEYADMQLIAEAYFILKNVLKLDATELARIFSEWQKGELNSYLIQITGEIFASTDSETGQPIVDMILDSASQKGTGKWTSQNALEIGVPVPSISEAVHARFLSAIKNERVEASHLLSGPESHYSGDKNLLIDATQKALYAAKLCSYAQGFSLLEIASIKYNWNLDLGKIAEIWREGCIIRAKFLNRIMTAFHENHVLKNLLLDPYFTKTLESNQKDWRFVVTLAINNGIPIPAFSSALAYFDGYRSAKLPANLIQAQREYFGAHGFKRVDKKNNQLFHHHFQ